MNKLQGKGIDIDPEKVYGVPTLAGRRLTLAQLVAELAEGNSLREITEDYRIGFRDAKEALETLATYLNQSFLEGESNAYDR